MKKALLVLVAIVGVGAVAAGGAWFVATNKAITHAQALVTDLNSKALPEQGRVTLTYDALTRSGFPAVGVRFVNPVLTVNVPTDAAGRPAIDAVITRAGTVDVITDYLNNEYRVVSDGADTIRLQSGTQIVNLTAEPARMSASVSAKDRAAFARWNALDTSKSDPQTMRAALQDIATLRMSVSPIVMKDTDNNTVIFTQAASAIDATNRSVPGTINFDLDLAFNGMEVTKDYSATMARVTRVLQLPDGLWNDAMPLSSSRAGKQDVVLAMQVNMPDIPDGPIPNGFIKISKLLVKNNFYSFDMPLEVVLKEAEKTQTAKIVGNATLNITPAGAAEMQRALDLLDTREGMGGVMTQLLGSQRTDMDNAVLKQKLTQALPTVSTLGPITLAVDIDASVPSGADAALKAPSATGPAGKETLTIRALSFNHARWGLEVKGFAARQAGSAPTVDMTILCKRCDTMTQDMFDTALASQAAMNYINPERPQWPVSDALLANVNATLADIGKKDATSGDITFGIGSTTEGDYRVNDKPMAEILPKLMALFAPLAAPDEAPAAGMPDPAIAQ